MLKPQSILRIVFAMFFVTLLPACNLPIGGGNGNQGSPADQTAVAQTVQANQTAIAQSKATHEATDDPGTSGSGGGIDKAEFMGDVTIPDGLYIEKGAIFQKIWRLQNIGESTWTIEYRLVFDSGERLGSPEFISMPKEVKPGEIVELTVEFTAPDTPGEYESNWMLQNDRGEKFGVEPDGIYPVWVKFYSVEPSQAGSGSGIAGGADIANVTLGIDQAVYSGACPASFTLSWTITTSNAGIVQHTLDLVPNTSGFTFTPTGTYTANFYGADSKPFSYDLTISDSVNATARVNTTGSSTVLSNLVGFSVYCQ